MPHRKPVATGITFTHPSPPLISMPGMSSDHTEAATITPEANPSSDFCTSAGISCFMKNTNAAPVIVPSSGSVSAIISPSITVTFLFMCR